LQATHNKTTHHAKKKKAEKKKENMHPVVAHDRVSRVIVTDCHSNLPMTKGMQKKIQKSGAFWFLAC